MRTFSGRLWLVKDRYSEIDVEIELDLDEEQFIIRSEDSVIGDWSFDEIVVSRDDNEVHILAEGEELVVVSGDVWFAPAITQTFSKSGAHGPTLGDSGDRSDSAAASTTAAQEKSGRNSRRRGAHRKRGSFKFKW